MKKMFRQILAALLVAVMLVGVAPMAGLADIDLGISASALSSTGQCGDNVFWSFDSETGTLTITGEGKMYDYNKSPFWGNSSIKSVIFSDSVMSIGECAFEFCECLTNITIPDSVTSIGDSAFYNCTSLESLTIPDSVTNIGNLAFFDCTRLKDINVSSGNEYFSSQDGVLFNKDKTELIQHPAGNSRTEYSISASVTSIGVCAFSGCRSLTSITIPNSVTSIGNWAFSDCTSLTSVMIGNSVTSIGGVAFFGCTSLTRITIPDSVISIGNAAFRDCTNLKSITIPDSVTSIGDMAFYDCTSLANVYYNGTEEQWNNINIGSGNDCLINATIHFAKEKFIPQYTIPDDLTAIYNDYLGSVLFPFAENGYWEWDGTLYNRSTRVGNVGVNYFKANFVPYDTENYETVYGIDVPITVSQAKPDFEIPKGVTARLGQTLADVELPETDEGKFVWNVKSPEAVILNKLGTVTYVASYVPNNENYMTVSDIGIAVTVICDHTDCEWTINKQPTVDAEGETVLKCLHCGEIIQTKPIERLKSTVKGVEIFDVELNYKSSAKIPTAITADSGAKYTVTYSSSNPKVATVDENGNVYAAKKGTATITCTVTDSYGNTVSDTCTVNVKYSSVQWLIIIIIIILFGWIWYI